MAGPETSTAALKDWWPSPLRDWALNDPMSGDMVEVASIEGDILEGNGRFLQFYTGLVDSELAEQVIALGGKVGHDVSTSGPHPSWQSGDEPYEPRFWIWAGNVIPEGMEPFILAWNSGNRFVLAPDPRFLMTYGLIPRPGNELVHWDDVRTPQEDVAIVQPVSYYDFPKHPKAWVSVKRNFVRDYATIRNKTMLQVYFARCYFSEDELPAGILTGQ